MEKDKKVTPLYLKTFTQKFDLNTIFLLDLSKRSLSSIGSIPECTNLLMLDLSYNQITVISGIETLTNLKHLNISYNKLTQIDALKGCVMLEKIEAQGNMIKDTRTLEVLGPVLTNIKVLYLQEFNFSGSNTVCGMKNYRKKVFEIFPKMRALDGHREGIPVIEPGNIDTGDMDKPDYKCDEEWFNPDIYLTNPTKAIFQSTQQSVKEESDLKNVLKDCENLLNRKTNVLTL